MGEETRAPTKGVVYRSAEFGLFLFCGVQCICFRGGAFCTADVSISKCVEMQMSVYRSRFHRIGMNK